MLISASCSQDGLLDLTVIGIVFFSDLQEKSDDESDTDAPIDCAALRAAAFFRLELLFINKLRRSAPIIVILVTVTVEDLVGDFSLEIPVRNELRLRLLVTVVRISWRTLLYYDFNRFARVEA